MGLSWSEPLCALTLRLVRKTMTKRNRPTAPARMPRTMIAAPIGPPCSMRSRLLGVSTSSERIEPREGSMASVARPVLVSSKSFSVLR